MSAFNENKSESSGSQIFSFRVVDISYTSTPLYPTLANDTAKPLFVVHQPLTERKKGLIREPH